MWRDKEKNNVLFYIDHVLSFLEVQTIFKVFFLFVQNKVGQTFPSILSYCLFPNVSRAMDSRLLLQVCNFYTAVERREPTRQLPTQKHALHIFLERIANCASSTSESLYLPPFFSEFGIFCFSTPSRRNVWLLPASTYLKKSVIIYPKMKVPACYSLLIIFPSFKETVSGILIKSHAHIILCQDLQLVSQ